MMPRVARRPRPVVRTAGVDLSRKTSLVPRPGLFSRGAGLALKRGVRRALAFAWRIAGFVLAAGVLARLALGGLTGALRLAPWDLLLVAGLAGVLVHRLSRRLGRAVLADGDTAGARRRLEQDLELAAVSVAAVYAVLGLTGSLASPLYPALYLVVALLMVFHRPAVGIAAVALTLVVEGLLAWRHGDLAAHWTEVFAHGGFVVAFAGLYHGVLAAGLAESRRKARRAVDAHVREIHARARAYRLVVSGDEVPREKARETQEKWLVAAVQEVEAAVRAALEVAEAALDTHTVAVMLLSPDEKVLRLHECLSASDRIVRRPFAAGEGLPGVVLRRLGPVRLCGSFRGAVYDEGPDAPKAFLGVPLLEKKGDGQGGSYVRGVLVADRLEERTFTDADERVLEVVAREVLRAIEVERVMGYIRKEKDEKSRFYRAIEALNVLSKPGEICEAVTRLASTLAPVDFVAVTLVEEGPGGGRTHRVLQAVGPGAKGLPGLVFPDNAGLVANVVRLGSPLPGRDFHAMEKTVVFTEAEKLRGLSTLKVLPLSAGEAALGTVVCGATARSALTADAVRMLGVLAIQAAGAIERGRLFEKTERMATTDGLTGLNNHRRFQELLDGHLAAARRYGRSVSLAICDVDHFKGVNDTYGHPVGDKVLKGVSRILQAQARDTDVVARYGGEEFAVVLPETDTEGAMVIAERIRATVAAEVFQTELGPLKVTISLGVATCPRHAGEKQALIDLADQALYGAKDGGRNRVVCQPG